MTERVKAMEHLDRLVPTDLWGDIEHRQPGREPEPPIPRARRVVTVLVALAIAAVAIALPIVTIVHHRGSSVEAPGVDNGPLTLIGVRQPKANQIVIYGGPESLWSVDPTTGEQSRLRPPIGSPDQMEVFAPRWSPGGTRVLWYKTDDHVGPGEIWTSVDGTLTKVVSCRHSPCVWDPEWSPDGSQIAFARGPSIMVVNADGSHLHQLSSCPNCTGLESGPTWSPDGSHVAYAASDSNYDGVIYVAATEGNATLRVIARCDSSLCKGGARDAFVSWSPTGDTLVFDRERNVWSVNANGSGLTKLTSCPVTHHPNDCEPGPVQWSSDGTRIAFVSGEHHLTLMAADGTDVTTFELQAGYSYWVDGWQPVPETRSPVRTPTPSVG